MLADLDELILKCPDPRSRAYIKEAVACYKSGAYRSSVVSTWIAIAFDLIDKIRFLSGAGDAQAAKSIEEFDRLSASVDVSAALRFEKGLLDLAKDKLELISHAEYLDLKRIAEDRNRCAHPSHTMGSAIFEPPSELARLHIVNAVTFVLMQPPAQGKAALDRLIRDLDSNGFPSRPAEIQTYLSSGPLAKPRRSLLRNFIVVLLKRLVDESLDYKLRARVRNVLKCTLKMHPAHGKEDLALEVNRIVAHADDKMLRQCLSYMREEEYWIPLQEPQRIRMRAAVENLADDDFDSLEVWLDGPLKSAAEKRVSWASASAIISGLWFDVPDAVLARLFALYRTVSNYADANKIGHFLRENAAQLEPSHIEQVVAAAASNSQVKESLEFPKLLQAVAAKSTESKAAVNGFLAKSGLDELAFE